ncbi:MAG TPA: sugar phosphate nucleotidyltransferase [Candidatus Binatia bacterium]
MRRFAVIMAGGSGERFWPASRRARPKQLLRLTDARLSMLEEAIERIAPLIPRENIVIATSELLAEPIAEALPSLPRENVLAEPEKRNTAACLALAAAHLEQQHGDPEDMVMAVLTADHQIGEPERFRADVARALDFAATEDALVTIGIVPTRPETGYGYIEVSPSERTGDAADAARTPLRVLRFREKPDEATARAYARSGHHYWNSGMFFWRVSTFLRGLARHMPDLSRAQRTMRDALASRARGTLREAFAPLADVSIDVGLMERADNVWVLPAGFPWDDVGAWDALERTRTTDAAGNVVEGDAVLVDARDSIVFNEADEEIAVALVGVEKVIVAITRDGVLVCSKDRAQDVRRAVAELRKRGRERFT